MKKTITIIAILAITAISFGQHSSLLEKKKNLLSQKNLSGNQNYQPKDHKYLPIKASKNNNFKSSLENTHQLDSFIYFYWDNQNSQWDNMYKYLYYYDSKGNVNEIMFQIWNEDTKKWDIEPLKVGLSFDLNGNLTEEIEYYLDEDTKIWKVVWKDEMTYNSSNQETLSIQSELNESTNELDTFRKIEYTYSDTFDNYIIYDWNEDTDQFVKYSKSEIFYNTSGQETLYISTDWNEYLNQWYPGDTTKYYYDTDGNMIERHYYHGEFKQEYSYDANKNLTQRIVHEWNSSTKEWEINSKYEYLYDDYGNFIKYNYYSFDLNTDNYILHAKEEFKYDLAHNRPDLPINPGFMYEYDWQDLINMPTEIFSTVYDEETGEIIEHTKFELYYSELNPTSVKENNTDIFKIFPNPASENLTINSSNYQRQINFELFDIQGKKVMSQKIENNETIDISLFSKGIYLYKISSGTEIQSGKLIKK